MGGRKEGSFSSPIGAFWAMTKLADETIRWIRENEDVILPEEIYEYLTEMSDKRYEIEKKGEEICNKERRKKK